MKNVSSKLLLKKSLKQQYLVANAASKNRLGFCGKVLGKLFFWVIQFAR